MSRKLLPPDKPAGLPSRADILAFVKLQNNDPGKNVAAPPQVGKREIARAFGLRGAEKIELKRLLKEMEAEGLLQRQRRRLHSAERLPSVVLADVIAKTVDGDLIATPVEWNESEHGAPPKIVIVSAPSGRRAGHGPMPSVGDRALLRTRMAETEDEDASHVGSVLKIMDRQKSRMLGVFRADPKGGGHLAPIDKKSLGRTLRILPGMEGEARDGDLVAVSSGGLGRSGVASARVVERIGSVANERAISMIALRKHGIPDEFSAAALNEAETARPASLEGREDWRDAPLVTIDPPDAKDHDDAVAASPDPDPHNPGGFILTVAIADVAAYVRPNGALDREASERGNSIYFPDRVVPMLPERISNDLCSLRPHEDRPALAVRIVIDDKGRKLRHSFHRIMMRSVAKLAYGQAQAAIDGGADETARPLVDGVLRPLWRAYDALKIGREHRSPLDLEIPERKLLLREDGSIDRVVSPPRLEAHKVIEEFMILANVCAAETLEERRQPLIYRAHDAPTIERINELSDFLSTLGIKLAKGQAVRTSQLNAILARIAGAPAEILVNETILRTQAQAEYTAKNYGHFGLNLRRYAHFTSPIRRYADLVVHRALIRSLSLGEDGLPPLEVSELEEIAAKISAAERRAVAAERETVERLIATWLSDRIGAVFEGRVSGTTRAGLFVRLLETGADGFVPASTIGDEYFRFDERRRALVGDRSRRSFKIGDEVTVRLVEAAPFAGALRFEVVGPKAPGSNKGRAVLARDSAPRGVAKRSRR